MTLTDGNFEEEVMNSDDIWFVEVGGGIFLSGDQVFFSQGLI